MEDLSNLNKTISSFNPLEKSYLDETLHITKEGGLEPAKLAEKIEEKAHKILQNISKAGELPPVEREKLVRNLYGLMRTLPKVNFRLNKWAEKLGKAEETQKEAQIHFQHIQTDINTAIQKLALTAPCLELGLCFDPVNNERDDGAISLIAKDMILQGIPLIATRRLFMLALKDPEVHEKVLNSGMCIVHEHQEGDYIRCVPDTEESRNLILEPTKELEVQGTLKRLTPKELENLPSRLIDTAGKRSDDTKHVLELIGKKDDRSIVSHMGGHGNYSGKITGEGDRPPLLCNLEIDQFQQLITGLDDRGASFVSMDSCFAGGANAIDYWKEQDETFDDLVQPLDLGCNVVIYALGEREIGGGWSQDYKEMFTTYRSLGESQERIRSQDIDILKVPMRQQKLVSIRPAIRWAHGTQFKTVKTPTMPELENSLYISPTDNKVHSIEGTPFVAEDKNCTILESLVVDSPIYITSKKKGSGDRPSSWPESVNGRAQTRSFPGFVSNVKSNCSHYIGEVHAEGVEWRFFKRRILVHPSHATNAVYLGKLYSRQSARSGFAPNIKKGEIVELDRAMFYRTTHGDQQEYIGTFRTRNDESSKWEYHKIGGSGFKDKPVTIDKYTAMYHHYQGFIHSKPTEEALKSIGGLESAEDVLDALKEKMWTDPEDQLVLDLFDCISKGKLNGIQGNLKKLSQLHETDVGMPPEILSAALRVAVQSGHTKATEILLKHTKGTPNLLGLAISANQPEQVNLLLKAGADITVRNDQGETPLMQAARKGNLDILDLLLDAKVEVVDTHEKNGKTALHYAAHYGHKDAATLLVKRGADLKIKDKDGLTPLHTAVKKKRFETFKTLVELGGDVNTQADDGSTPLHFAAHWGRINILKVLFQKEADLNVVDGNGKTPLALATEDLEFETIGHLLKASADINAGSVTPLMNAVKLGQRDLARYFLEKGAKPETTDAEGNSLAHHCENLKSLLVLQSLDITIDYDVKNQKGNTPLRNAVKKGNLDLVRELLNQGTKPLEEDKNGNNLLHILIPDNKEIYEITNKSKAERDTLVSILKDVGVKPTTENTEGKTAIQLAEDRGIEELAKILNERGRGLRFS